AVASASDFAHFMSSLTAHTSTAAGSVTAFGSSALADRLLLDGPVYTSFLALVQLAAGIAQTNDFASHARTFGCFNAIIDALCCVLIYFAGRKAFGGRTGLIAALLMCVYPPAIINTMLCYAEPFSYFLLTLWVVLAFQLQSILGSPRKSFGVGLALGCVSALIMLSRSIFFPLPAVALFILICMQVRSTSQSDSIEENASQTQTQSSLVSRVKPYGLPLIAMAVGALVVMAPWIMFTHSITGKFTPWVNRAPGYNLYVGNQLRTDGWRTWPAHEGICNDMEGAVESVSKNLQSDPSRFSGLLLRKLSRLWAGVWNDFKCPFLKVSWMGQNLFHDLILLLAVTGMLLLFESRAQQKDRFQYGIVLGFLVLYHCLYACFEPVARYAISAMPFAVLLASYTISYALESSSRRVCFLALLIYALVFFAMLDAHFSFIPVLSSLVPAFLARVLDALLWICGWTGLCCFVVWLLGHFCHRGVSLGTLAVLAPLTCLLTLTSISALAFDPARFEWECPLAEGNTVVVHLETPATDSTSVGPCAFLLVDMQSDSGSPSIEASI
ncbi:MAG: glycosyltransferase family 39 protein, partial [Cyanobacteria bacterium]|nr:glycosyltransferase family 39 protein [Cyanobacteriota bacterium]